MTRGQAWRPDVLGRHFEQLTLPLGRDTEGEVVATLVRYTATPAFPFPRPVAAGVDVLYVHGWSDYFFQRELAAFWHRLGARFFAIDLRKYGRSLRPGQTPGFISELNTYDEDIAAALEAMGHPVRTGADSRRRLVLMGHSTGGLTVSLWAERHPGAASALVLNSPWLEFQAGSVGRGVLAPVVELHSLVAPKGSMPAVDLGYYTRSVSADRDGEWTYDLAWRPERGFPMHPAWMRAVLAGHAQVAGGLHIDAPIVTMLSARSHISVVWSPEMMRSDVVLAVNDIAHRAIGLGAVATVVRIDDALHDVILSPAPVRAKAYAELERWLGGYLR